MKRLLLMRHAKTEPWFPEIEDASRSLVSRGQSDTKLVAERLIQLNWLPDKVLVSPARRTLETWSILKEQFPSAAVEIVEELYLIGTRGLANTVRAHDSHASLMIIGHNPGLHDFGCQIMGASGVGSRPAAVALGQKMPTASVALFEAASERAFNEGAFPLVDFIRPKTLRQE